MLVLTRRVDESVVITVGGVEVRLKVSQLRGDAARLAFTAPASVVIDRAEVHDKVRASGVRTTAAQRAAAAQRGGG